VRVIAKLRLGLVARIDAVVSYWVHVYGLVGYTVAYTHYIHLAVMLVKLMCFIAWLSHAGACLWFYLQRTVAADSSHSWLDGLKQNSLREIGSDKEFYVEGWYWSVSTMFSGSSYLPPNNVAESVLAGFYVIMGALFVTAITSTLAAILIESQEDRQEMKRNLRKLTLFMEQRDTPVLLALAVRANMLEQAAASPIFTEADLPVLGDLTPALQAALRESQYAGKFLALPFFRVLNVSHYSVIRELCFTAAHIAIVKGGEQVFTFRHEMQHALLLAKGEMLYNHYPSAGLGSGPLSRSSTSSLERTPTGGLAIASPTTVEAGAWVCELALFLQWRTVGILEVDEEQTSCEMLYLSVEVFMKAVMHHARLSVITSCCVEHIWEVLQDSVDAGKEPTDIDPCFDCDNVIANMHVTIRELVSMPVLQTLRMQQGGLASLLRRKTLTDLEQEVVAGKCHLVIGPTGEVGRVVRLVVLRLLNQEGKVCVKIGQGASDDFKVKFQLPGTKVEAKEHPEEAILRLLDEDFQPLRGAIRWDKVETVVDYEHSASFDLQTKYIKTVQTAVLEATMDFANESVPFLQTASTVGSSQPSSPRRITSGSDISRSVATVGFFRLGSRASRNRGPASPSPSARGSGSTTPSMSLIAELLFNNNSATRPFAVRPPSAEKRHNHHGIGIYKWLDEHEHADLATNQRKDVEAVLGQWLGHFKDHPQDLEKLAKWTLNSNGSRSMTSDTSRRSPGARSLRRRTVSQEDPAVISIAANGGDASPGSSILLPPSTVGMDRGVTPSVLLPQSTALGMDRGVTPSVAPSQPSIDVILEVKSEGDGEPWEAET